MPELAIDLEQVTWKSDVAGNVLADINKSDPLRTHLSDALGYYVARIPDEAQGRLYRWPGSAS